MKQILAIAALAMTTSAMASDSYHQGYVRRDGTYVQPHYQTAPNNTAYDNYSTRGNVNPYTGKVGTVNPDQAPSSTYHQSEPRHNQPTYQQPAYQQPQTYHPKW